MKNPDPGGILLAESPPGTPIEKTGGSLLSYMLRGPHWFPYEPKPIGSRNALVAAIGSGLFQELDQMRELGWVAEGEHSKTAVMFHATDAGLWALGVSRDERLRVVRTTRRYRRGRTIFPHPVDYYHTDCWEAPAP